MTDKDKQIWCLFSIDNNYDQPPNNLVAWWANKPTIFELAEIVGIELDTKRGDAKVGRLFKGEESRIDGADYRLELVKQGVVND